MNTDPRNGELAGALDALPDHYCEVILLANIERLTTPEIADRLGKSRDEVPQFLFRAVRKSRAVYRGGSMRDNPSDRELARALAADLDVLSEIDRAVRKPRAICEAEA